MAAPHRESYTRGRVLGGPSRGVATNLDADAVNPATAQRVPDGGGLAARRAMEEPMVRTAWSIVAIAVACGAAASASAQPVEQVDVAPPAETGGVRGRIVDPKGEPVAGAIVTFAGTHAGTITDGDGSFLLADVAAGSHQLAIDAFGFAAELVDVTVTPGETARVDVTLKSTDTPGEQIVVVGSRAPEKRLDAPVTVEVVGEHDLRTAGGPSYLSALSRVKGIDFSDAGLADQRISARGFATQFNSRMLTMVDGRLAMLPGNGLPQGNLLPVNALDMKAVEVVIGPASALYGPNAHTGVVNVVTKTPWDESGAAVTVRGGSRGLAGGAARVAGTVASAFGWKLGGEYLRGVDFSPDAATHDFGTTITEEDLVDAYDVENAKADGTLYYRRGDVQLSAGGNWSDTTGFSITNAGRNHLRDWQVQTQTAQLSTPHVYAQVTRTASDAGQSYQLDRLARTVEAMGGVPADPQALEAIRDMIAFVDESSLLDSELQVRQDVRHVKLTAGVQARRYLPSSAGTYLDDADTTIRVDEVGVYAQADAMLLDERLRLAAAGRVDHHDLYGAQLSPKVAVQYEVAPAHNVRVGWNRAFKSPTVLENFLKINDVLLGNRGGYVIRDAAGTELARIDPLTPEQVDAVELGYKGAIGSTLYVDAVAYWSWYRDFISPLTRVADPAAAMPTYAFHPDGRPVAEGTPAEGTLSTYVNFGRAQVRGVDVGVDYRPNRRLAFAISGSVLDLATFSNDDALQRDLRLNAPALKVRASAQVSDLFVEHTLLRVDGRAHSAFAFESGYWNSETLLGGDVPGRVVVDVTAGWDDPERGMSVTATIANLTNDHHPDVLGAPEPGIYGWLQLGYRYDGLDLAPSEE
jgi:outer membrane receptor for ferrienterochelin and colicins